ncbi:archease [Methanothermobacter thermautotrophicus]|uniref:Protein archease n=1 Tax=Methanothermobacter thermautotrophicus TaxID=145262 RepID=A0A842YMK4_METTF|nr:archease [Methanothermobacter thermautotrophicus]MBE2899840.1 archease [Methanothermobacter thermautotrophicus]
MKGFEFFDVTADAGYWAYGHTLEEVFENAALAMFEVMTDTSLVEAAEERRVEITSEDRVSLLYDWLDELLFIHDTEFILFSKFKVKIDEKDDGLHLKGTAMGETIKERHERRDEVKAVTFHMMDIMEDDGLLKARVILDL